MTRPIISDMPSQEVMMVRGSERVTKANGLSRTTDTDVHVIHRCHVIVTYRKTSNISRTLVGNKIVDNSDVVGASPVGAAPTTSSFST